MSLAGKVALVTGAATGIGRAIAIILTAKGAQVAVGQKGAHGDEIEVDIADAASVERLMQETVARHGRIDVLVNNASLTGPGAACGVLDADLAHVNAVVDVNLKGTFYCSQAAARRMIAGGSGGSIVNIASVGAFAAQEHAAIYCATKAAQVSLTQSLALELAPYRIRVNAIAPGDILTEASAGIVSELKARGSTGRYLRATPLGRRGTPEEVAYAVAFLASEEASFITGASLLVDGGFLAY